jgi:hypothetical protein
MARPKGSGNKIGTEMREHFIKAFHHLQLDEKKPFHLVRWAEQNPKDFYGIASKLFPLEVTGADGKDLIPTLVIGLSGGTQA